jgi:hypothetical protein
MRIKSGEELPSPYQYRIMPGFLSLKVRRTIIFILNTGDNDRLIYKIKGEPCFILNSSHSLEL